MRPHIWPQWLITMICGTIALFSMDPDSAFAHPGHDAVPEAAVQVVGDVAPRFYAVSDMFEAVLVFPDNNQATTDAVLYLTTKAESAPVASAEIVSEVLTPSPKALEITAGLTSGTYTLSGLNPVTTSTISLEITAGTDFDFMTFENVILPPAEVDVHDDEVLTPTLPFGLPPYLVYALVAVFLVMALANIVAVAIWLLRHSSRRAVSKSKNESDPAVLPVILLGFALLLSPGYLLAHAGDDHSGASLSASATLSSGSVHFVSIQTQFQGDVRTTQAVKQMLPESFEALGEVVVRRDLQADVTPPAEGKLKPADGADSTIPIAGNEVKKGQILVVLEQLIPAADKATLSAERSQVEAELNQATQELALAASNADRADKLRKVIAAKEVEEAMAARTIAAQKLTGLKNRLASLTQSLTADGDNSRDIPIVSPISGVIVQSHVTQGEYVSADKLLYEIVNLDEVFVQADIFESDIASVSEASTATVTLEAYPGRPFYGMLHSLGQQIDREQRTLRALFNVPNPGHLLRGGMFVNVSIQSGTNAPAITIPKAAIFSQDGIKQVYKKLGPETYVAAPVVISRYSEDMAVVSAGLSGGDRIAVSGLYQIRMAPVIDGGH